MIIRNDLLIPLAGESINGMAGVVIGAAVLMADHHDASSTKAP